MVFVIETQIATEETTWTLILEGPSQKFSALQSLATSRQYAPMQLHCTTDVARREILAERSHSIFLSMWIVDQPLPWRPRAGNRGLGVTLLRALVTCLWYTGTLCCGTIL